jgi:asparagine synthase (glutamine-hydrolysing)
MSHFLLVDDPDPARREQAARNAERLLKDNRGLRTATISRGQVTVVWGTAEFAPLSTAETADHSTVLIGDALLAPGQRATADSHGDGVGRDAPPVYDGIHLAITVRKGNRWIVSGDLLGLLPVYHTAVADAFIVASSPGLLATHSAYRHAIDPLGLAGILLLNHAFGGRTTFKGVRRLAQGHALRREPGRAPHEVLLYTVPASTDLHDIPMSACVERLHDALLDACRRHVEPGVAHTLLLSGGHDSRLLAGMLARLEVPVTALTRGVRSDNDCRFARRVARRLGFPHLVVDDEDQGSTEFLESIQWSGMSSSPGRGNSGVANAVRGVHPRAVSGYIMDAIVGGTNVAWGVSTDGHAVGFDAVFEHLNAHAVPLATLRRLLRRDVFGDSVEQVLAEAREHYDAVGDSNLGRAWRFGLEHRQRFWVGSMIAMQAEGAWPVAPHLDRAVLTTAGGIPFGMLAERAVEKDIIVRYYNHLASLPLDRNSPDTTPLDPGLRELLAAMPRRLARKAAGALRLPRREDRYYYRTFDLEGPGWRSARMEIEARREAGYALFEPDVLREQLPAPGEPWPSGNRLRVSLGIRLLMGSVALMSEGTSPGSART